MKANRPREKWSAAQLLDALQKAEARAVSPKASDRREREALREELERAHARETALLSEIAALRGDADARGISEEQVSGKPALAKYRRTWREFADAVFRLPRTRQELGAGVALHIISSDLAADLHLFELDAPRGVVEAQGRDRVRRLLINPSYQRVLMDEASWADRFRRQFVEAVLRAYFRPSIWRLYERAADEPFLDGRGTVWK